MARVLKDWQVRLNRSTVAEYKHGDGALEGAIRFLVRYRPFSHAEREVTVHYRGTQCYTFSISSEGLIVVTNHDVPGERVFRSFQQQGGG